MYKEKVPSSPDMRNRCYKTFRQIWFWLHQLYMGEQKTWDTVTTNYVSAPHWQTTDARTPYQLSHGDTIATKYEKKSTETLHYVQVQKGPSMSRGPNPPLLWVYISKWHATLQEKKFPDTRRMGKMTKRLRQKRHRVFIYLHKKKTTSRHILVLERCCLSKTSPELETSPWSSTLDRMKSAP